MLTLLPLLYNIFPHWQCHCIQLIVIFVCCCLLSFIQFFYNTTVLLLLLLLLFIVVPGISPGVVPPHPEHGAATADYEGLPSGAGVQDLPTAAPHHPQRERLPGHHGHHQEVLPAR